MLRKSLAQWLGEKPYTLSLGAGFFGFYAHAGVLLSLAHARVLPARLTGSSAGALVAALFASGKSPEAIVEAMLPLRRADFWDPGVFSSLWRLGLLKGERYESLLFNHLECETFEECTRPLCISVFDVAALKTRFFTQGPLARVVRASTSYPLLFAPVKVRGRLYSDGGVRDMPALGATKTNERVLCHSLGDDTPLSSDSRKVVALRDLPRLNPFKMHEGEQAVDAAFKQMNLRLQKAP